MVNLYILEISAEIDECKRRRASGVSVRSTFTQYSIITDVNQFQHKIRILFQNCSHQHFEITPLNLQVQVKIYILR